MEQQKTSMTKILKFLPRATSSHVSFQNPPIYSPKKDKRLSEKPYKSNLGIGFSGTIIPSQTHRKTKTADVSNIKLVFEPTSPRVSCMGTVKCKQYRNKLNNKASKTTSHNKSSDQEKVQKVDQEKSKKKTGFRSIFSGSRKSDATNNKSSTDALNVQKAPCLSTMKRFSSGRDAFSNFDWTTQVTPLDLSHRNCFTDDEDDDEIVIPSSAPVMVRNKGVCDDFVRVGRGVNVEPKKEINLWKRRTMAKPQPLQLY
ncbi:uncharacterized protein At1g76070-like [Rutidosis leptorrhynchoides]|uniref:uncharacterized protein At1g76070-like n=1 Tax=Rutidosis leptorrhynchoides TaxID=125765 RepID=UPI003A9995FF